MVALLLRWVLAGLRAPVHERVLHRLAVLFLVLASCGAARAQQMAPGYPDDFMALDAREVRLLPPYCVYSQIFSWKYKPNEVERKRWEAALGPTFTHIHHYCFALLKTNRALFLTKEKRFRMFYLSDSMNEFKYIIDRSPDNFVLLPEILTKKGENLVRLGQGAFAVFEFERAIELKPDYWPPYAQLADYYKSEGDKEKAREVLSKGLSQSPDVKALQQRLAELDQAVARRE
jgi:tetratricopeptide (TPR) repeat protein